MIIRVGDGQVGRIAPDVSTAGDAIMAWQENVKAMAPAVVAVLYETILQG